MLALLATVQERHGFPVRSMRRYGYIGLCVIVALGTGAAWAQEVTPEGQQARAKAMLEMIDRIEAEAQDRTANDEVGRFQITGAGRVVWMVDTKTGLLRYCMVSESFDQSPQFALTKQSPECSLWGR